MRSSRLICAMNAFGMLIAIPGLNEDGAIRFAVSWMIATGVGWLMFDREIRREMASRE